MLNVIWGRQRLLAGLVLSLAGGMASAQAPLVAQLPGPTAANPTEATPAAPDAVPTFKPGLWEYQRTLLSAANAAPQKSSFSRCSDPSQEIRQKLAAMKQKGCTFTPLNAARRDRYVSTWKCPSTAGGTLVIRNAVTVKSDRSYQDVNEIRTADRVTRSLVVANRIGDCSDGGKAPTSARAMGEAGR